MKIEKRYVVGALFLIPMLPAVLVGFIANWTTRYLRCGYELGEMSYEWIEEKVN